MNEQIENVVENGQENGANLISLVGDIAVKTVLVGLGTVGYAQDEFKKIWQGSGSFVHKLEERGESMSNSGRERLEQRRENLNSQIGARQEKVKELGSKTNETIEKASGAVLTLANVPTSEDIQTLSKQISSLNRKVDKMRKEQQEQAVEAPVAEAV